MRITVKVWRQAEPGARGRLQPYTVEDAAPEMSFLELLDVLDERLLLEGQDPVAFDSDCREGICGSCGALVEGVAHGPARGVALCQLYLRQFHDGDVVVVEPFRARPFPLVKDLVVDRSALDRIIQAGGFVSTRVGGAPEANTRPVGREATARATDAASCIGCGACVAACPNGAAQLFTASRVAALALLPQGRPERHRRAREMVAAMEAAGFGPCSNLGECEAVCPKGISMGFIGTLNREHRRAATPP